ncbi:cytochrome P450 [Ascodesmis nigricans]|uniref:Cytochrome P450 n=1 Tax=Ascodesmis nigricans TaxID=341454 RepID=A0A4V3SJ61_9PEZI|nr:cytochrome P450 [Ascodesmis nigricans]
MLSQFNFKDNLIPYWQDVALLLFVGYLSRVAYLGFYNLFLHPLRKYPGPKLAAITRGYAFYWNVTRDGELYEQLLRLHARYGSVVRIEPNKLHFSTPSAYNTIYTASTNTIQKDPDFYNALSVTPGLGFETDPKAARRRREFISHDFSRRNVLSMEKLITDRANQLIAALTCVSESETGSPSSSSHLLKKSNLYRAFRSITLDLTADFGLGTSMGAIETPGFSHPLLLVMESSIEPIWWKVHDPVASFLLGEFLLWVVQTLGLEIGGFGDIIGRVMKLYDEAFSKKSERAEKRGAGVREEGVQLDEAIIPRMVDAGWSQKEVLGIISDLVFAGTDTVGNTLLFAATHLLLNPKFDRRLLEELSTAWPDITEPPPPIQVLEKLPFLQAVVRESLRVAPGVLSPLWRLTKKNVTIDGFHIPAGTTVASSAPQIHFNPDIFENPHEFDPTRWLDLPPAELSKRLSCLVSFSKGSRSCVGINLGYVELTLILAMVWRKCEMKLDEGFSMEQLRAKDHFVAIYPGTHVHAWVRRRTD